MIQLSLLTKILFSSLVDADWTDSLLFEEGKTFDEFEKKLETKQLWAKANRDLLHYLDKISKTHPGALNSYRSEIGEAAALVGKTEPTGIYRMTTPTGGGKTLSGMRFALEHAMAQKKEKIFYITHYLTVLEQNVNTIREAMPSLQGEILEFHSNVMNEERVESDEIIYEWKHKKNKLLQERWDTPVIFTSMVQFLNTFFHERKSSGRRLHQFANAIILFDEAQSVPTHTVGLFCQAVNFLRRMNSTSVICTATQPHFEVLDYGFDVEWNKTLEIVPDVEKYFEKFKRQRISLYEPTLKNSEEAADFLEERMKNTSSLLMICNTVKAASAIYQEIKARGDTCCYYLSTALCPVHRRVQLKEIRKSLQQSREASGQKVICITTPIIEAGVDISFETVVRSLSGLDSIAQAGGRGNRNKERDIGDLIIVELGEQLEKISYLKEIKAKQGISRGIILFEDDKQDMDLFSQEAMQTFFKKLHEKFNSKEIYKHRFTEDGVSFTVFDILNENKNTLEIKRACNCDFQPFFKNRSDWRTANRNFWVIDEKGVNVLVPYKNLAEGIDGAALIAELESGASLQEKVKLLRSAQQFMITLFDHEKKSLGALGALRALGEFTGVYVLDEQFYSMDSGYQGTKDTQELSFLDI